MKAGQQQLQTLNTNTRYLHENLIKYSKKLCDLFPDPLNVAIFVNSGSEANELALRMSKDYTKRKDIICLESAYHGNTNALIDISPYKFMDQKIKKLNIQLSDIEIPQHTHIVTSIFFFFFFIAKLRIVVFFLSRMSNLRICVKNKKNKKQQKMG